MTNRIFIYPADLMQLTGRSYWAAYRTYQILLASLGKEKGKKITIKEYCRLEDVDESEVKTALNISS